MPFIARCGEISTRRRAIFFDPERKPRNGKRPTRAATESRPYFTVAGALQAGVSVGNTVKDSALYYSIRNEPLLTQQNSVGI